LNIKCPITIIFIIVSSQSKRHQKDGFISHLTYLVQLPYLGKSQNIKMANLAISNKIGELGNKTIFQQRID